MSGDSGDSDFQPRTINIRNLSIKCGNCGTYQTLCGFQRRKAGPREAGPREEWNVYTYECENDVCDPAVTRTYLEVAAEIDEFADRDPEWHGGAVHAGAGR